MSKDKRIVIRIDETEYNFIKEQSEKYSIDMSTYCRKMALLQKSGEKIRNESKNMINKAMNSITRYKIDNIESLPEMHKANIDATINKQIFYYDLIYDIFCSLERFDNDFFVLEELTNIKNKALDNKDIIKHLFARLFNYNDIDINREKKRRFLIETIIPIVHSYINSYEMMFSDKQANKKQ